MITDDALALHRPASSSPVLSQPCAGSVSQFGSSPDLRVRELSTDMPRDPRPGLTRRSLPGRTQAPGGATASQAPAAQGIVCGRRAGYGRGGATGRRPRGLTLQYIQDLAELLCVQATCDYAAALAGCRRLPSGSSSSRLGCLKLAQLCYGMHASPPVLLMGAMWWRSSIALSTSLCRAMPLPEATHLYCRMGTLVKCFVVSGVGV